MIIVSNLDYVLRPGRLYVVVTENPIVVPQPGQWHGRFEEVKLTGVTNGRGMYRMENEKPWPARDAYVWFMAALGYHGNSLPLTRPPVVIFDAESERSSFDVASKLGDLPEAANAAALGLFKALEGGLEGFGGTLEGIGNTLSTAGTVMKYLPWIVGGVAAVGLILVVAHYVRH